MKKTGGKANPKEVRGLILKRLAPAADKS